MKTLNVACAALGAAGAAVLLVNACAPAPIDPQPAVPPAVVAPVTEPDTSELGGMVSPDNIMAALDTPCEVEDSVNCYWRADLRGNGQGTSFVNIEGHVFPLTAVLNSELED